MFSIFIGLMAVAEAVRPGLQLPKTPVLAAAVIAFIVDFAILFALIRAVLR